MLTGDEREMALTPADHSCSPAFSVSVICQNGSQGVKSIQHGAGKRDRRQEAACRFMQRAVLPPE